MDSTTLTAEYAFRYLSQCLAPVAVLRVGVLSTTYPLHIPLHYLLSQVIIRNPLFMLLGRLGVPFLLIHALVSALVIRAGFLTTITTTATVSATTAATTATATATASAAALGLTPSPYTYMWTGSVAHLAWLYVSTLMIAIAVSLVIALVLERPIRRYTKDIVMDRFGVARQWRDLL